MLRAPLVNFRRGKSVPSVTSCRKKVPRQTFAADHELRLAGYKTVDAKVSAVPSIWLRADCFPTSTRAKIR